MFVCSESPPSLSLVGIHSLVYFSNYRLPPCVPVKKLLQTNITSLAHTPLSSSAAYLDRIGGLLTLGLHGT